jgi:hypothetical protein
MKEFVQLRGKYFNAYIPKGALITFEYNDGIPTRMVIEKISSDEYCLVNGIKFYGCATNIYLCKNLISGTIKQECIIEKRIKGSLEEGIVRFINATVTIEDNTFIFKPINEQTQQKEEYEVRVLPDYSGLLQNFFKNNPMIDIRVKDFLNKNPQYFETLSDGHIKTNADQWKQVSEFLQMDLEEDFLKTNILGLIDSRIADSFLKFIEPDMP